MEWCPIELRKCTVAEHGVRFNKKTSTFPNIVTNVLQEHDMENSGDFTHADRTVKNHQSLNENGV